MQGYCHGDSCLRYACYCPNINVDMIQFLLGIGGDKLLMLQNSMGWTALMLHIRLFKDGEHKVIQFLQAVGGKAL